METSVLDSPNYEAPNVKIWPIAIKYGIIGAITMIIITLVSYLSGNMDISAQMEEGFSMSRIIMGGGIFLFTIFLYTLIYWFAVKTYREELGGFISFGKGFKVAFFSVIIKAIFVTIFTFIFYQFIASEFLPDMINLMEEQFSESGMDESQIEGTMKLYGMLYTPMSYTIITFFTTLIGGVLLSLIAAAIGQKEPMA